MLWLAGLMGLAGVGAASFVGLKSMDDDEADETQLEDEELYHESSTDLLEEIQNHSAASGDALASQPSAHIPPAPAEDSSAGWGDDILNEIMAEFDDADESVVDQPDIVAQGAPPLLLEDPINIETDDDTSGDFSLTDWITERAGVEVLDYTAERESLMLVWDDVNSDAPEPEVDVTPDPDDPEVMQVTMNGENVAEVFGDTEMDASDLTLIPLSSAMIIGLAPAIANIRAPNRAL